MSYSKRVLMCFRSRKLYRWIGNYG